MQYQDNEYTSIKDLISGYGDWINDYINEGYTAYLMTFKFRHMPARADARQAMMQREISQVYSRLLTRIVRRPNGGGERSLPVWICTPDLPVPKRDKVALAEVKINDGLHYHAIALIPPTSRLKRSFDMELAHGKLQYVPADGQLWSVHVEPIKDEQARYVTEYAGKSLLRHRFGTDSIWLLPKTTSEMIEVGSSKAYVRDHQLAAN